MGPYVMHELADGEDFVPLTTARPWCGFDGLSDYGFKNPAQVHLGYKVYIFIGHNLLFSTSDWNKRHLDL